MPLELRELIIRVNIGESPTNTTGSGSGTVTVNQSQLVATCVEQVLEILNEKHER